MPELRLDPVKYELLYQKLDAACNEAKDVVQYLSGSVIAREAGEVVTAFYLPSGEAASMACAILMHIMTTTRVIQYMKEQRYVEDIGINPDDQFISNDAYIGGMHVPDTVVVAPIFCGDELVGWAGSVSHTTETGGIEPGGMCPSATEACHDGILIPAIKFIERGVFRRDLLNMFLRPVRDPLSMELDIKARVAGNERLKERVKELIDELGMDFFKAATEQFVVDAEAQCRAKIKALRPGIYTCRVYSDVHRGTENRLGVIHVELEICEEGQIIIRAPVVSPQIQAYDNAYFPAIESTSFYHLLTLLFYDTRWNTGMGRVLKLDIPKQCRINADPNRSVGYATVGIAGGVFAEGLTHTACQTLYASGKLEDIMQNSTSVCGVIWGGINQLGRPCVQIVMSLTTTSGGARIGRDGIDGLICGCTPAWMTADIEGEEMLLPLVHLTNSYSPDSSGFGKYRGGTGVMGILVAHGSHQIVSSLFGMGSKISIDQGMFGGYPRAATSLDIMSNTDFYEAIKEGKPLPYEYDEVKELLNGLYESGPPSLPARPLRPGDVFVLCNTGGPGIGDSIEREPERIVRDIKEHKATISVSIKAYCVAIDPKTLEVDYEETQRLREEKRKERLRRGIPAKEYLRNMIESRNKKSLPKPAQEHHEEMLSFSSGYREILKAEEEWLNKGLEPLKEVRIEKILLALTPYLNIIGDDEGKKIVACSKCEFAYCDAQENWKLYGLIYDRDPAELRPGRSAHDKNWCIYREFYCPGCGTQVEVEACPPGAPIMSAAKVKAA